MIKKKTIISAFLAIVLCISLLPTSAFAAATITTQPANTVQAVGSGANFQVTANPTDGTTYQWQQQTAPGGTWSNVSGGSATSSSYTTGNVTLAMATNLYRVLVTNGGETTTSSEAKLFVRQNAGTTFTGTGVPFNLNETTTQVRRNFAFQATAAQAGDWMLVLNARKVDLVTGSNITVTVNGGTPTVIGLSDIADSSSFGNIYVPVTFVEGANTVSIDATIIPETSGLAVLAFNSLASADYRTVADPTFSRPADTYGKSTTLELALNEMWAREATAGIRYTLDGSVPSATNGTVYTGPFRIFTDATEIGATVTVNAIGYVNGKASSAVVSRTFTAGEDHIYYASVTSNRASGELTQTGAAATTSTATVTLTHPDVNMTAPFSDVSIYYTTDGSDPTVFDNPNRKEVLFVITPTASPATRITVPIKIVGATTLKAVAIDSQGRMGSVGTWNYTLKSGAVTAIQFPANGLNGAMIVGKGSGIHLRTYTNVSPNTKIFYTTDGSDPVINAEGTAPGNAATLDLDDVNGIIEVPPTLANEAQFVVKAIGAGAGITPSSIATFTYTFDAVTPRLSEIKYDDDFKAWKAAGFPTGEEPDSLIALAKEIFDLVPRTVTPNEGLYAVYGGPGNQGNGVEGSAWRTNGLWRYGIPDIHSFDGPAGLRMTAESGLFYDRGVTFWPNAAARNAAWNMELAETMGEGWGRDISYFAANFMLAPGMNIHRNVLNGRNFEYYSEDPLLSGLQAAAETNGIQAHGDVGATLKHFAVNNHETNRNPYPTEVSVRALREIYLRNFQYATENSKPWMFMTSYNQINGVHAAVNPELIMDFLRDEWGYKNSVMTDYGGYGNVNNLYPYYNAYQNTGDYTADHLPPVTYTATGVDGSNPGNRAQLLQALNVMSLAQGVPNDIKVAHDAGYITDDQLWEAFKNLMVITSKLQVFNDAPFRYYSDEELRASNMSIAEELAIEGSILLKNETVNGKPALPLAKPAEGQKILSLGLGASRLVRGGSGSGTINMTQARQAGIPQVADGINNLIGRDVVIDASTMGFPETASILDGATGARAEMVIPDSQVTAWSNDPNITAVTFVIQRESAEGREIRALRSTDRIIGGATEQAKGAYYLSDAEQKIIDQGRQIASARNIPFVIVMNTGSWGEFESWKGEADAILQGWETGEIGFTPTAKLLFGDANPSGKLNTSVPIDAVGVDPETGYLYNPSEGEFGVATANANPQWPQGAAYREGIFMGYRYFDSFGVPVSYPFGHGLSYTNFNYTDPTLSKATFDGENDTLTAGITITNSGNVRGKETAQFYIGAPGKDLIKPVKELKGFAKTDYLNAGQSERLTANFNAMSLASYDEGRGAWVVEPGEYTVYYAASVQDIRQTMTFTVANEIVMPVLHPNAISPDRAVPEYFPPSYGDFVIVAQQIREKIVYPLGGNPNASNPAIYEVTDGVNGRVVLVAMADTKKFGAEEAKIIIALYDENGKMISSKEQTITLNSEILSAEAPLTNAQNDYWSYAGTTPYTWASATIDIDQDAAKAKAYLWKDGDYVPLNDGAYIDLK